MYDSNRREHPGETTPLITTEVALQVNSKRAKKENILDLTKYMDNEVNVKCNGGREGSKPKKNV
jgi:hypothetical protein